MNSPCLASLPSQATPPRSTVSTAKREGSCGMNRSPLSRRYSREVKWGVSDR